MPRLDSLVRRLRELEARSHQGWTASTTPDGKRAWIKDSGIHLWYELIKFRRDTGSLSLDSLPEDLHAKVGLWSRVELDESICGGLAITTREWCCEIMGIDDGTDMNTGAV